MSNTRKVQNRLSRKKRIRARLRGTSLRPRLSVYRSLASISVQLIDDDAGKTIASASTGELKTKPNTEGAKKVGEAIAKKAKEAKVSEIVFDRNAYRYHGRIKALAESARESGLKF